MPDRRPSTGTVDRAALVVLIAAAACSTSRPIHGPFESGTRLRAIVDDGGDGAVRLVGWHDAELDADCRFVPTPSNETRCMTLGSAGLGALGGAVSIAYLDAACTEPVAVLGAVELPRYVAVPTTRTSEASCGDLSTTYAAHELSDDVRAGVTELWVTLSDGSCAASSASAREVRLLEPTDDAVFVRGREIVEARSARLSARVLVGDDGSREMVGLLEAATDRRCSVDASRTRCLPISAWVSPGLFANDACSEPLANAFVGAADCVPFAVETRTCDESLFYEVGDRLDAAWTETDGACTELVTTVPTLAGAHFRLGAAIPADTFPAVAIEPSYGAGRLAVDAVIDADGTVLGSLGYADFFDRTLGVRCSPVARCGDDDDAPLRCVTREPGGELRYLDADCTEEVVLTYRRSCAGDEPWRIARPRRGECIEDGDVVELGDALEPTTLYVKSFDTGTCSAQPPFDPAIREIRTIAERIDADSLPTVVRRIE